MPNKSNRELNELGQYLYKRSINKAQVCRKTGIHPARMTWLCYEFITFLKAYELQLIALAIKVDPSQMQRDLFGDLKLKEEDKELSDQEKLNLHIINELKATDNFVGDISFNIKDIERCGKILAYCEAGKTEKEILGYLDLKRKSSNFTAILKTGTEVNWLIVKQTIDNGRLVKTYTTTEIGKKVLSLS